MFPILTGLVPVRGRGTEASLRGQKRGGWGPRHLLGPRFGLVGRRTPTLRSYGFPAPTTWRPSPGGQTILCPQLARPIPLPAPVCCRCSRSPSRATPSTSGLCKSEEWPFQGFRIGAQPPGAHCLGPSASAGTAHRAGHPHTCQSLSPTSWLPPRHPVPQSPADERPARTVAETPRQEL